MKKETFSENIEKLENAFRTEPLNEGTLKHYWHYLKPFRDEDFSAIVEEIIKTQNFFPTIAVFLKIQREQYPKSARPLKISEMYKGVQRLK